jgi:hypothetical protein
VLAAVKRAVDRDRSPGQFLLTGSIRGTTEPNMWAGTGRVVRLAVRLRRYLTTLALNLAGQPSEASLIHDADINTAQRSLGVTTPVAGRRGRATPNAPGDESEH